MEKKYLIMLFLIIIYFTKSSLCIEASSDDYTSYVEIIMNDGKLLSNFTEEEYELLYNEIPNRKMFGYVINIENDNVDATYISNTLYSIENKGNSNITYQIDVVVETNNKTSFKASGGLNGKISGKKGNDIKGEIGAECGLEYSSSTSESRKETQKLDIVVEPNSRCVIYLTGNLSVTNGVLKFYYFWIETYSGGFEIVTLQNQYTRIEKAKI